MIARRSALSGARYEIRRGEVGFPAALEVIANPPACLRVVGNPDALQEGLAVVGARKATPYGVSCAKRFAGIAAARGIVIISGGARGCDAVAHEAALDAGAQTVVFLGGGCDELYPAENTGLFQRVIDAGGAVVSEHDWGFRPLPFAFRERNRLIAGLARATLIVEAGLPSGTFSTADEALAANREVLVVPGAITSANSRGANRLIYQGATPIVDDDTFDDQLFSIFGCLRQESAPALSAGCAKEGPLDVRERAVLAALEAEPLGVEALRNIVERAGRVACSGDAGGVACSSDAGGAAAGAGGVARVGGSGGAVSVARVGGSGSASETAHSGDALTWLMVWLACAQRDGLVAQYPDGRYGPCLKTSRSASA